MPGITEKAGELFGRLRGAAKDVVENYGGIFRRLAEEHGEVSAMMMRVESASDDSGVREELFPKIRRELLSHAKAEERIFYPALLEYNQTEDIAKRAMEDHGEVERMLAELEDKDPKQASWMETFKGMRQAVQSHVEEEENEIFPKAKDVLTNEQIEQIEKQYDEAKTMEMRELG